MIAFPHGEVFLKSATFESIMRRAQQIAVREDDRGAIEDALLVGCLWPERLGHDQMMRVLIAVMNATREVRTLSETDASEERRVVLSQTEELQRELIKRYPEISGLVT
jgi:hypothetical protein